MNQGPEAALTSFVAAGVLTSGEALLAHRLADIAYTGRALAPPLVLLGAAMAVRAPRLGHVCLELDRVAGQIAVEPRASTEVDTDALPWPDADAWRGSLAASPLVRGPGPGSSPLVLDGDRLYLDRYWDYEQRLADNLRRRVARPVAEVDRPAVTAGLRRLFGVPEGPDRQRLAAALTALRRLTVIAGGPGTGKTYTVTRVLALLHAEALARDPDRPLRAALAAPTGKAAARLQEALREGVADLDLDADVRAFLESTPATTIHRLLGSRGEAPTRFRHDGTRRLPYDLVIVDEASMVSLPLMAKLVEAVGDDARLVLLGDRDQLASVEAGAAFGDICGPHGSRPVLRLSARAVDDLESVLGTALLPDELADAPGIWDGIARLDRYQRFDGSGDLAALASAIQREEDTPGATLELLRRPATPQVRWRDPEVDQDAADASLADAVAGHAEVARLACSPHADPAAVLAALGSLRVLCAVRHGPQGTRAWNAAIEARLADRVPGYRADERWYPGRPVLVTANDHTLRLYNGDVGVILADPVRPGGRVALFAAPDGSMRRLNPARLPPCETTYAMTVHKSQGSQFTRTLVVLPDVPSPVLSRELVYTAVTRATAHVTLLAPAGVLAGALRRPIRRATGLEQRLWGS